MSFSPEQFLHLYQRKETELLSRFSGITNPKDLYEAIIALGNTLPPPPATIQTPANLVEGCQSLAYLTSFLTEKQTIRFAIQADALISLGLAALLFTVYDDEPPQLILLHPPMFLQTLGLAKHLSPGRSNGLASMYSRMKKDAMNIFLKEIN